MNVSTFLDAIAGVEGRPYLWAHKGDKVWTPKGLRPHGLEGLFFDCSGLVTWGLLQAGWFDVRATHSANVLMHELKACAGDPQPGDFAFYGYGDNAQHVEVMAADHRLYGAMGTRATTKPTPDREVRYRRVSRPDLIAWRMNPLRAA